MSNYHVESGRVAEQWHRCVYRGAVPDAFAAADYATRPGADEPMDQRGKFLLLPAHDLQRTDGGFTDRSAAPCHASTDLAAYRACQEVGRLSPSEILISVRERGVSQVARDAT